MKVFKIYCYSKCGSYFNSYLQSVTVVAVDRVHAIETVKLWLDKEGREFIRPESEWTVEQLTERDIYPGEVIDWHSDSDY